MRSPLVRRRLRARRRLRVPFDLRKAMFVLPNLFTVSSIFCGFYAITLTMGSPKPLQLYRAAVAVFFGIFFDMADGRVARLTKTQSAFGVQLDSLADAITFGVTPAVIVYRWALWQMGLAGQIVAFVYIACGAMRLARFNVLASRPGGGSSKFFTGLPIPLAAGVLVSLVMFHQKTFASDVRYVPQVVILVLVLSYLMVSNIRYRTFKDARLSRRSIITAGVILTLLWVLAARMQPTFALLAFFCGYVAMGLFEEVIFFRKRRQEIKLGSGDTAGTPNAVTTQKEEKGP